MPWQVVYFRYRDGSEPVSDAIDGMPPWVQAAIDNQIERLAVFGPHLGFPYTSQIDGGLRELRCHFGPDLYRILYRRSRNLFVLLGFLPKHSPRVPEADIELARQRWDEFVRRMAERPRRPPRAAGHDAP
ncbi:MAG: type II toxin-antitoxin system RelE/ParE family toxin [Chloroflexi bacterium]|nr:type II toxin-antitoxin system RelE/ParE family toxin [Chloroflexota bacterium]